MPRKSSPAVQKAAAVVTAVGDAKAEQDITPRRSARAAAKRELSPGSTEGGRSRRSSTAAQTAASVAESRVTRSRNSLSSRRDSSSPSDNRSGRSSGKEFGLESPASRVKMSRRTTGRINYKESDGEEEVSTPKNEEDDYNADDDFDESDSEGASKAKNKGKIVSPPKSRVVKGKGKIVKLGGRGRGRPAKRETDGEEEEEEDLKEEQPKTGEASEDSTEQISISSGRKRTAKVTPISGQEDQDSSGTRRSRRVRQTSGPETGGTEDSKTRRSSRGSAQQVESPRTRRASRKQSKQDDEQFEDGLQIDEESEKYDATTTELDGADPKLESDVSKKRKMEEEEEPSKRLKLDNESEKDKDSKSMDNINVCRDGHDSDTLKDKTIETNKLDCKDESNISFKDKKSESSESVVEVPEDVEEMEVEGESDITVNVKEQIVEEPMEVDKTNSGSVPIVTVDDSQSSSDKGESNDSVTAMEESKADNQTVDKMESHDKATVEISRVARSDTAYAADSVAPVPFDKKQDNIMSSENMVENMTSVIGNEPSSAVEVLCLSSDVTNDSKELINADKCAEEEPDQQPVNEENLDEDKEEIDIASQSSEASESLEKVCDNSLDPKDIIEPSSVEEDAATNFTRVSGEQCENLKNISKDAIEQISDNPQAFDSATIGERSVEALDSCSKENIDKDFEEKDKSISDSKDVEFKNHKSPFPEKASLDSTVAESSACSENTFHSEEQNAKASLNGSESDEKINSVLTAQAVTISSDISTENVKEKHSDTFEHVENPAPKANGAHDVIRGNAALSDEQVYVFPNRRYVLNSSLSEDLRLSVKDRMFGFVSYNLGFVIREDSMQKDKLVHELQKLQADIICLQEVTQSLYREVLEPSLDALGYKSVLSIPEGSITGLVTFYKNSVFRLSGLSEASLQKLIEKDLEASSLEPEDKTAVHSYLKKCGNVLFTQFTFLIGEHSLTVANVLMPPSDISTHALQMSCLARELVTMIEGATKPLLLCGAFNMAEGEAPYQLLRDGYLSNDMIEELQRRKDVVLPGKENAALVNLLWKAFQHPSSNLCSCYASVLGRELFIPGEQKTTPDLLWFSSDCLHTVGVLDVSGSSEKPEDCHFSLKADVAFFI